MRLLQVTYPAWSPFYWYLRKGEMMKRIALTLPIPVFLLLACTLSRTVTPLATEVVLVTEVPVNTDVPVNTHMPVNTEVAVNTEVPVNTKVPVNTEVPVNSKVPVNTEAPVLGSTRISETDGMTQVFVPGGNFKMGSDFISSGYFWEDPIHTVFLDPYWIDQTEVTNVMFAAFVTQSGYQTEAEKTGSSIVFIPDTGKEWTIRGADWQHPQGPDSSLSNLGQHPVVQISWNDALAYCKWAGRRLPTEAEWEKAARGTNSRTFPWGNEFDGTRLNFADINLNVGWGNKNFDDGFQFTSPVGNYPSGASPYGALDMAGNVWEWVNDWGSEVYYQSSPSDNPGGPDSGIFRIYRGGSWQDPSDGNRTAFRGWIAPTDAKNTHGVRCALTP
jgi:formylglycine-generating enzyme required for sulfatase activity